MNILLFTWVGLLIQVMFFAILKPIIKDLEIASIILIGINFLFYIVEITKYKSDYRSLFLFAYIIRVVAMFWDIYAEHIYPLPHSGVDSVRFFYYASLVSSNLELLKGPIYGSIYTKMLGLIFYITSPQRLIGQYINTLLGTTIIIIVYKILDVIEINNRTLKRSIALLAFAPHSIIFSGILLRENLVNFFAVSSFYCFVMWYKNRSKINILYSLLLLGISATFHSGVIGIIIGYVYMYLFYNHKTKTFTFTKSTIYFLIVFILVSYFSYFLFSDVLFTKFNKIKSINDIIEQANVRGGGSAYLTNFEINSLPKLILFGPIKTFYFLTSPLPVNWRGIEDIISFIMDSLMYLSFIFYIIINYKKFINKHPLAMSILIMILTFSFIFGVGIANAGTAMRHRQKILPLFIVLYAITSSIKIKDKLTC